MATRRSPSSRFPWDKIKGDTLRVVCRDLGFSHYPSRREEVVQMFLDVESKGLETVLRQQEKEKEKRRGKVATVLKRQRRASVAAPEQPPDEQVSEPRRSGREPRMSMKQQESISVPAKISPSRPRRTSLPSARRRAPAHSQFMATKKAKFDGVELPALRPRQTSTLRTRRSLQPVNQRASRSFSQLNADTDESMEVD